MSTTVPTGNTFDKYGSGNPLVRRLMAGFEGTLDELFGIAAPSSVLDVGCGEGILTEQWAQRLGDQRIVGLDLDDPKLGAEWARRGRPNLEFVIGEALEHIPAPDLVVAEMARVASRWLLVSVPREPLWRMLNVARGAYLRELGNTPGHLNHWSKRAFVELLGRHGDVIEARSPFPWTMLLVRLG
jgi:SAM-dependent methyltransferase